MKWTSETVLDCVSGQYVQTMYSIFFGEVRVQSSSKLKENAATNIIWKHEQGKTSIPFIIGNSIFVGSEKKKKTEWTNKKKYWRVSVDFLFLLIFFSDIISYDLLKHVILFWGILKTHTKNNNIKYGEIYIKYSKKKLQRNPKRPIKNTPNMEAEIVNEKRRKVFGDSYLI